MGTPATGAGWSLTASGNSGYPAAHQQLFDELAAVLSDPSYGCGSSEFNGPFVAGQNFHVSPDQGSDPGAGATATGDGQEVASSDYVSGNTGQS